MAGKSLAGRDGSLGVFVLLLFVWGVFWGEGGSGQRCPWWLGGRQGLPSPGAGVPALQPRALGAVRSWWGSRHGPILAVIILSGCDLSGMGGCGLSVLSK